MKVLFICGGLGYGHVSRCISLANSLAEKKKHVKISFAFANVNEDIAKKHGFDVYRIHDLSEKQILDRIENSPSGVKGPMAIFDMISSESFIDKCVKDEIEVIEKVKPDFIIYDGRFAGNIAAKIKKIHSICLIQNYLLQQPEVLKSIIPNEKVSSLLLKLLEKHKAKINEYRAKHNVECVEDIFNIFTCDENYAATIKEFGVIADKNKNIIKFAGAFIKKDLQEREEWESKLKPDMKTIYVSTGGNDSAKQIVKFVLDILSQIKDIQAIVSVGFGKFNYDFSKLDSRIIIRKHVNTVSALKYSDLVITHGGHTTIMECLAYGVPALVIPYQPEQMFNGSILKKYGIGDFIPIEKVTYQSLKEKINNLIEDNKYIVNISKFNNINAEYLGPDGVADIICKEYDKEQKKEKKEHEIL